MIDSEFIGPYIVTNIVSATLILLATKWPRLTRIVFILIFVSAGLFNIYTALTRPEAYHLYGDMVALELYRNFIHGFFKEHTQAIILTIALGQLSVAALLSCKGNLFKLGVVGGIIFFVAIAPLGFGSAFSATLLMALALIVMHQRLVVDQDKST